jgi:SMODS-associated and fused to various effectors sensor domain
MSRLDDDALTPARGRLRAGAGPAETGRGSRRSASGARIAGDDYQHLVAWCWTLRALLPGQRVVAIEVEAPDVGNVDDVVLVHQTPPHHYLQAKYAVDATRPVNSTWLTRPASSGGPSLLQRFHASWRRLRAAGGVEPVMWLVTNRDLDHTDPALAGRDGRTQTIDRVLTTASPGSEAGRARAEWAAHLGIDDDELLTMLASLRFDTGRGYAAERQRAADLMAAQGLRAAEQAVTLGIATVRGWVADGRRRFDLAELRAEVDRLNLRQTDPWCVLLIQAIDRHPHPEDATVTLDWVDLLDGETPFTRRRPRDPAAWETRMRPELRTAADRLRTLGCQRVLVRGALRLPTWFTVGSTCAAVTGMTVACQQGGRLWSADEPAAGDSRLTVQETPIGQGDDLAVAVAITTDPTDDVRAYLAAARLPIGTLATLTPAAGAGNQAIAGPGHAVAVALAVRDEVRRLARATGAQRLHLFLACPGGLALLLGHWWNRVPTTQLYEDLGAGRGYTPAFLLGF